MNHRLFAPLRVGCHWRLPRLRALAVVFALLAAAVVRPVALAGGEDGGPEANVSEEIVTLPAFVTSALRVHRNPWRYGKVDDFEVLTRADEMANQAIIDALRAGKAFED